MIHNSFSSPVNASLETLWAMLVDKVENPQRYIGAVQEVKVQERFDNGILRVMKIPGMQLTERITINEPAKEITFTLVDHPLFSGEITNTVAQQEDSLILTFTQSWQPLTVEAEKMDENLLADAIKNAVLHMKQLAEEQDGR